MNNPDYFSSPKNNGGRKFKSKKSKFIDEDKKDMNRLNKSFKHRKREITEQDDDWKNWNKDLDS